MRKKEIRSRMKTAAIWAVVVTSLATTGQMQQNQSGFLPFLLCLILYGFIAAIIYFIRLTLSKFV